MKKWVMRFRAVDRNNFNEIKKGVKRIETRAATVKYLKVQKGDILVFICGESRLSKKVKNVHIFKSIPAMLDKYKMNRIMPSIKTHREMHDVYYGYPGYKEKIKKYGLVAFELK